jgi:hypothetical protein
MPQLTMVLGMNIVESFDGVTNGLEIFLGWLAGQSYKEVVRGVCLLPAHKTKVKQVAMQVKRKSPAFNQAGSMNPKIQESTLIRLPVRTDSVVSFLLVT